MPAHGVSAARTKDDPNPALPVGAGRAIVRPMTMSKRTREYLSRGWTIFPWDSRIANWVAKALPVAHRIAEDRDLRRQWLRCGGTWFAGVNALPNDRFGAVPQHGVPALGGKAVEFAQNVSGLTDIEWDPAQISICYPGYPQPWEGESPSAFRFRRDRDAAHVDGLMRQDPGRRRKLGETHAFILGLPMTDVPGRAAPLVVYEGSHEIIRTAFQARFAGIVPEHWTEEDLTDAYVAARREAFERCPRVTVAARPGEAYLVHRLAVHGVAPWSSDRTDGMRMIAYFRPEPGQGHGPDWWLNAP